MTEQSSILDTKKINKSKVSGELAIQIIAGDAVASNKFVQLNYSWLLFVIRKKFSGSNNHEDIVQDTFMLVINKLQQGAVKNPNAILAYLRTTAIHIGFEYLRKDKKFTSAIDQEMLDVIEDSKDDILSSIIWDDKIKFVKQVIDELKIQRDKDILFGFYFNDDNKQTICKQFDLKSEHFDRVLYRAKLRLKELIDKRNNNTNGQLNSLSNNSKKKKDNNNLTTRLMFKTQKYIHDVIAFFKLKRQQIVRDFK